MANPSADFPGADFIGVQYQFTGHIRDPGRTAAPADIPDERMGVYREMVYNNIQKLIANNFPVIRKIHTEEGWHNLLRDYFAHHKARTPLFPKVAQEFLLFLENEREAPDDPPFLLELGHYEWSEAALAVDTREIDLANIDPDGDLLDGVPVLSTLAWPLAYQYPVHRIGPDEQPQEPPAQPTYLVVYRDRNDAVGFMELNPITALLLKKITEETDQTGRHMLEAIAAEIQHPDPAVVINGGLEIMQRLHSRDVLLGTRL